MNKTPKMLKSKAKMKAKTKAKAKALALVLIYTLSAGNLQTLQANEGQPKLFEPYAPKPSGKSPDGWEIKILEGSQVENSSTLSSGKDIKVTVPAYEVVPKTNQQTVVLKDPGFDPLLGTTQNATIGAILTDYSEATVELQAKLEKVTQELEKSLGSPTETTTSASTSASAPTTTKEQNKQTSTSKSKEKSNEGKKSNSTSR